MVIYILKIYGTYIAETHFLRVLTILEIKVGHHYKWSLDT